MVHGRIIAHDFVLWDDNVTITENTLMETPWSWALIGDFFDPETAMRFKPLHWLLLRLFFEAAAYDPVAWHAFSLVLHMISALALFAVYRMIGRRLCRDPAVGLWIAGGAAALWAVHPLRVEPVAWVTASSYLLVGALLACAMTCYLSACESESKGTRGPWLIGAWALAVSAYACYPVAVGFVGALIAVDYALLGIGPSCPWRLGESETRRWWFKQICFAAPAVLALAATVWSRYFAPGLWSSGPSLHQVSWDERVLNAWASLALFPLKLLYPANLTPNHAALQQTVWLTPWVLLGALVSSVLVVCGWAVQAKRAGIVIVAVGYAVLAAPCLGLTERPTWPVDRYSHVIDMFLIGVAAACLARGWRPGRPWRDRLVALVLIVAMGASAAATRVQGAVWRDSDALFHHMEAHSGFDRDFRQQAHVYILWAAHLSSRGDEGGATARLRDAHAVFLKRIRIDLASGDLSKAVRTARMYDACLTIPAQLRRELASWLLTLGRIKEAWVEFEVVARALPDDERTRDLGEDIRDRLGR